MGGAISGGFVLQILNTFIFCSQLMQGGKKSAAQLRGGAEKVPRQADGGDIFDEFVGSDSDQEPPVAKKTRKDLPTKAVLALTKS